MIMRKHILAGLLVVLFTAPVPLSADPVGEEEEPAYSNAAQAMHAAQLAEAAALQPSEETQLAADTLATARDAFDVANAAYQAALDDPETDIEALREALDTAAQNLAEARSAYAEQVGALAGVVSEEIQAMRQSGMGWGVIALELGVHPGALGLGHGRRSGLDPADSPDDDLSATTGMTNPADELTEVTKRSAKSMANLGLGVLTRGPDSARKGLGLSKASDATAAGALSAAGNANQGVSAAGRSDSPGNPGSPGNSAAGRDMGSGASSGSQGGGLGSGTAGPGSSGRDGVGPGNSGKGDSGSGNSGRGNSDNGNSGRGGGLGRN